MLQLPALHELPTRFLLGRTGIRPRRPNAGAHARSRRAVGNTSLRVVCCALHASPCISPTRGDRGCAAATRPARRGCARTTMEQGHRPIIAHCVRYACTRCRTGSPRSAPHPQMPMTPTPVHTQPPAHDPFSSALLLMPGVILVPRSTPSKTILTVDSASSRPLSLWPPLRVLMRRQFGIVRPFICVLWCTSKGIQSVLRAGH